jgi:hypothetical protein
MIPAQISLSILRKLDCKTNWHRSFAEEALNPEIIDQACLSEPGC